MAALLQLTKHEKYAFLKFSKNYFLLTKQIMKEKREGYSHQRLNLSD